MKNIITNPDMERILKLYNIDQNNSNLFQHAYIADKSQDIDSSSSYFENGLRVAQGSNSFLATMSPYNKNNNINAEIEKPTNRGEYKIIISIPNELENMVFGSNIKVRGDAGNQYRKNILLDFLINPNNINFLPKEFIVGIYVDASETEPARFMENPNFYANRENSQQNIKNLKAQLQHLTNNQTNAPALDLVKYCLGLNDMSEDKAKKYIELISAYDIDEPPRFEAIYQAVSQKLEKEQTGPFLS